MSDRITEIENRLAEVARLQNTRAEHADLDAAVYRSQSDVAYLLAELRKRDEALARVHLACEAMDAGVAIRSGDSRTKHGGATTIRAVIREALGDGA